MALEPNLESEPGYQVQKEPPEDWVMKGQIEVKDLSLVYYKGGPEVLTDFNWSVASCEKIGDAGRTGASLYNFHLSRQQYGCRNR